MQMIARGKNASDLFPAVVKNVACKNIEVRISPESRCLWLDAWVILKFMVFKVYICIEGFVSDFGKPHEVGIYLT